MSSARSRSGGTGDWNGTTYPYEGEFYFAGRQVNQNTGAFHLAALFANPGNAPRPGQ
jgi:hypothetical protein